MPQSTSQTRRNGAPAPAPIEPDDLEAILGALEDAGEWSLPAGSAVSATPSRPPIAWPSDVVEMAESAGIVLPPSPPRERPAGAPDRWLLVAAPSDLSMLSQPIPELPERGRGSTLFLHHLMHGTFMTAAGPIRLPSMAKGEGLPLKVLLKVLSKAPTLLAKVKYLRYLAPTGKVHGRQTLIANLAEKAGRYCYVGSDFKLYLTDELLG